MVSLCGSASIRKDFSDPLPFSAAEKQLTEFRGSDDVLDDETRYELT